MATPYTYGGFVLNDYQTYFCKAIDLSPPEVAVTESKVARFEGTKKTGETVNAKQFDLQIGVLGQDRATLTAALDALYLALNQRGQHLVVQGDGRYLVGDCINMQTPVDQVAYAVVTCTFKCYQPFAYAATAQTLTTGNVLFIGGNPWTYSAPLLAGGTVFNRPIIRITNAGSPPLSNIAITNKTQNTVLTLDASLTLSTGDYVDVTTDPALAGTPGPGFTIVKNSNPATLYDFTGTFPTMNPTTEAWTTQVSATTQPTVAVTWTWTPRYLA